MKDVRSAAGLWELERFVLRRHKEVGPLRCSNAGVEGLKQQASRCPARPGENSLQSPVDSDSGSPTDSIYTSRKSRRRAPAQLSEPWLFLLWLMAKRGRV